MPAEIISQICEFLCPHCSGIPLRLEVSPLEREYYDSLRAFSRTSKRHFQIAQRFNHHRLRRHLHHPDLLEQCLLHSALGLQVREMAASIGLSVVGKETVDFITEMIRTSFRTTLGLVDYCFTWHDEVFINTVRTKYSLAMVPDIEALCLKVDLGRMEDSKLHYGRLVIPCLKPPLHKLRSLRLEGESDETRLFDYIILFLRVLFDLPALTDLTFMGGMVLERPLSIEFVKVFGYLFAGLKSLRFFRAGLDWDYENIAAGCPPNLIQLFTGDVAQLETFVYRIERNSAGLATEGRYLSPFQALQSLCCCQKSLRHLDLDLGIEGELLYPLLPDMKITLLQIQSFEYLQTLKLEETVCYRHWFTEPYLRPRPEDNSCLSRLIGPRLRRFTIRMADESRALDDLASLAHEANQRRFLSLEAIEIIPPHTIEEHEEVCGFARSLDGGSVQIEVWDGADGRDPYDDVAKSFEMLPKRPGFIMS